MGAEAKARKAAEERRQRETARPKAGKRWAGITREAKARKAGGTKAEGPLVKAAKRWAEAAEAARKEDLLRAKMCSLRRFKALFFHSRRKEKVRQETEAKRWPRRRRRKQRFEIMNEADERESMAALEQRDGSQVEGAVAI